MKNLTSRSVATFVAAAALAMSVPAVAYASSTVSTTSHNTAVSKHATTAWTTFRAAWATYVNGLKAINATYRTSVQNARSAFTTAMAAAKTKAERQTARATLDAALAAALNTRVTAITAAGDPPAPPAGYIGTAYVTGLQAANVAFRAAKTAAQTTLAAALANTSATASDLRTARLSFQAAIAAATVTRSNALLALGSPPKNMGKASA